MLCKRHWWFEKLSFLSLGEAGDWMFRDFKNPLYGSFEALFLSVQAYLMSAMITPEFVVLINDVFFLFFFLLPSQWPSAHYCWYSLCWCASYVACFTFFLAVWACACHACSRIRFTVYPSCFSLIDCFVGGQRLSCLIFLASSPIICTFLSCSS